MKNITKAVVIFLVVFSTSIVSTSCRKHRAFPDALKAYYPYQQNQIIYFHNENGETLELHITEVKTSNCYTNIGWDKCGESEMEFSAIAKYTVLGMENSYGVQGFIGADGSVFMDYIAPGVYDAWAIYSVDPYSPNICSIIGDTITMHKGTIVVRNIGVIKFKDENDIWYLTK